MPDSFEKDPLAVLDYQWDWSSWLEVGETIVTAVVTVPAGLTLVSQVNTSTTVTIWLSGGTAATKYTVECLITTNNTPARVDERKMTLSCQIR